MSNESMMTRQDDAVDSSTREDTGEGTVDPPSRTPWWRRLERWHRLTPFLLVLVAFGLYLPRLDYPEKHLFDEILFAYTAGEYVEGNTDAYLWDHPCSVTNSDSGCVEVFPEAEQASDRIGKYQWAHPPLGKLFIAVGIVLFGNDSFGWRISSTVAGVIGIVLAYRLGLALTQRRAVGVLTAVFLLLDGLYFVYSRMGLTDIYVAVIMMGAMLAFTNYLRAAPDRIQGPLFLTGLLLGMGIATKWNAGYAAVLVGLVVLYRLFQLYRESRREGAPVEVRQGVRAHLIWIPLALGAVPAAIYILAHAFHVFQGGYSITDLVELERAILDLQTSLETSYRTASRWWEWPLVLQPVWFGDRRFSEGGLATTYAFGTPFLYWAFLPAVVWLSVRWARARNPALVVLAIGFFGQWVPWILVGRESFIYHFLPAVPFGCLAVATVIVHMFERDTGWRRTLAIEYVVLVALTFAFFYPIYSYFPISEDSLALRMWLPGWGR